MSCGYHYDDKFCITLGVVVKDCPVNCAYYCSCPNRIRQKIAKGIYSPFCASLHINDNVVICSKKGEVIESCEECTQETFFMDLAPMITSSVSMNV